MGYFHSESALRFNSLIKKNKNEMSGAELKALLLAYNLQTPGTNDMTVFSRKISVGDVLLITLSERLPRRDSNTCDGLIRWPTSLRHTRFVCPGLLASVQPTLWPLG